MDDSRQLPFESAICDCPIAIEHAKLLSLWKEAQKYGWRLTNERPYYRDGEGSPNIRLFSISPPSDLTPPQSIILMNAYNDERSDTGRYTFVAVIDEITRKRKYYISFPDYFEQEIMIERNNRMSLTNWKWDLSWSRFAATGEGFSD